MVNFEEVFNGVQFNQLTLLDQRYIARDFHLDEICTALKSMHPSKALGLDGFHVIFFQSQWDIVGSSVSSILLDCLNNGASVQSFSDTFITLIPKTNNPKSMIKFRPISL